MSIQSTTRIKRVDAEIIIQAMARCYKDRDYHSMEVLRQTEEWDPHMAVEVFRDQVKKYRKIRHVKAASDATIKGLMDLPFFRSSYFGNYEVVGK